MAARWASVPYPLFVSHPYPGNSAPKATITPSLATLARTLAAATDVHVRSAFTRVTTSMPDAPIARPSTPAGPATGREPVVVAVEEHHVRWSGQSAESPPAGQTECTGHADGIHLTGRGTSECPLRRHASMPGTNL